MPNPGHLKELIGMLAPGLIILTMRSWFLVGPRPDLKERLLSYAVISAAYFALVAPLAILAQSRLIEPAISFIEYGALPVVLGVLFAFEAQYAWARRFWMFLSLRPVHSVPTAWDYAFSRMEDGTFLLITLTNDAQVAGRFGSASFASSAREERDLLIEEVWGD